MFIGFIEFVLVKYRVRLRVLSSEFGAKVEIVDELIGPGEMGPG
jgi:hypothetical protein